MQVSLSSPVLSSSIPPPPPYPLPRYSTPLPPRPSHLPPIRSLLPYLYRPHILPFAAIQVLCLLLLMHSFPLCHFCAHYLLLLLVHYIFTRLFPLFPPFSVVTRVYTGDCEHLPPVRCTRCSVRCTTQRTCCCDDD